MKIEGKAINIKIMEGRNVQTSSKLGISLYFLFVYLLKKISKSKLKTKILIENKIRNENSIVLLIRFLIKFKLSWIKIPFHIMKKIF